jgi:hypothetical protein
MHQQSHRAIAGAFVKVVDAQLTAIEIVDLLIVGRKRVVCEIIETLVGGAFEVHDSSPDPVGLSSQPARQTAARKYGTIYAIIDSSAIHWYN